MIVKDYTDKKEIIHEYLRELRSEEIQKDRMRFRLNLERIGHFFGFQIAASLRYENSETLTPLGIYEGIRLSEQPVVGTILRAGLPMHNGILHILDKADNAFISAFRKHITQEDFEVNVDYVSCPNLEGRTLIISDPMLASGASMELSLLELYDNNGKPNHTHVVVAIASTEGIELLKQSFGDDVTLWVGEVDHELTAQSYIVPGLGDAGDLAYGAKE